jgi:hypothetical protein
MNSGFVIRHPGKEPTDVDPCSYVFSVDPEALKKYHEGFNPVFALVKWTPELSDVPVSDLQKIRDVLALNVEFHGSRDKMNGAAHSARSVRFSPITSETIAALERVDAILADKK